MWPHQCIKFKRDDKQHWKPIREWLPTNRLTKLYRRMKPCLVKCLQVKSNKPFNLFSLEDWKIYRYIDLTFFFHCTSFGLTYTHNVYNENILDKINILIVSEKVGNWDLCSPFTKCSTLKKITLQVEIRYKFTHTF